MIATLFHYGFEQLGKGQGIGADSTDYWQGVHVTFVSALNLRNWKDRICHGFKCLTGSILAFCDEKVWLRHWVCAKYDMSTRPFKRAFFDRTTPEPMIAHSLDRSRTKERVVLSRTHLCRKVYVRTSIQFSVDPMVTCENKHHGQKHTRLILYCQ
jgi:hypothetical protein